MIVYITKYALTDGIIVAETADRAFEQSGMVVVQSKSGMNGKAMYHGKDWHRTLEDAVAQCESMRQRKIASINKQIERLEKMKFDTTRPHA